MNNKEFKKSSTIRSFFFKHQLTLFFVFAFAITWGIGGIYFAFMPFFIQTWGPFSYDNPYYFSLFLIAVYGPPISAFIVISIAYGKQGFQAYLKRLLNWKFNIIGIVILVSILFIAICTNFIYIAIGGSSQNITIPLYIILLLCLLNLIYDAGVMEELGWRGFALPHLQKKYNALWSSLILGVIWAIWHLPAFFISGMRQSSMSFPIWFIDMISLTIIMTVAYNKGSKGSIPLAMLIHWVINLRGLIFNVQDITFYLIQTIITTCMAVILILIFGPENLGEEKYTIAVPINDD